MAKTFLNNGLNLKARNRMNLEEYIKKIEILKNEITGCDNLMKFYADKKIKLIKELDRIYKIKVSESEEQCQK